MFEKEYNLNIRPLEIDLLVIKKQAGVWVDNEIGRIFRGNNILEYKSPRDELDIDVFYKASAYASLYKFYGKTLDSIKADDVTVSLVREAKPYGLLRYFKEHDYPVSCPYRGVYLRKSIISNADCCDKRVRRNREAAGKRGAGIYKICFGRGT